MRHRALLHGVLVTALALATSHGASGDPAAAESLFAEAQELLRRGDAANACPKLEESQRLDPTGATALVLARCWEAVGRTASAWASYQEALEFARRRNAKERQREIEARIAALTPTLPRLVVDVSPEAAAVPGLVVRRGRETVGRAQWGSPIAVDPGMVEVRAEAPGRAPWARDVQAERSREVHVEVPVLDPLPPPAASSHATAPAAPSSSAVPPGLSEPPPVSGRLGPPKRGLAVPLLFGFAGVSLAAGTYFAIRYRSLSRDADSLCSSSACGETRYAEAVDASKAAGRAGNVAIVAYSLGAAAALGGAVLLARRSDANVSVAAAPGFAGLRVEGTMP